MLALQAREMVDEQHAFEMIDLVLHDRWRAGPPPRSHAVLPSTIHIADLAPRRGTLDLLVIFGDREAAFVVHRSAIFRRRQVISGIDERPAASSAPAPRPPSPRASTGRSSPPAAARRPGSRPARCRARRTSSRTCHRRPASCISGVDAPRPGRSRRDEAGRSGRVMMSSLANGTHDAENRNAGGLK